MEVRIQLDATTDKGKVSAIRTVIGIGKLSFEERLSYVKAILGEAPVASFPPPTEIPPAAGRVKVKPEALEARKQELAEREHEQNKKEIKEILYHGNEYGSRRVEVCTYDKNWNLLATYPNRHEAANALRKKACSIVNNCDLNTLGMMCIWKEDSNGLEYECYVRWKWDGGTPPKGRAKQ